ncbi:mediator complex, subunit Med18 [Lipomyces tetrasporus]|uniref:Mediator of RNA polymerase II transcription subunit 18 n=1 Tax=Lipomyces tetrasporus TaxID=54092 RepID=A0AAD7QL57_9ASCO|nr:mediator complex, subunit Med18 [Lipomyces tetrasporus]KAJ8096975.1 mediator complex, subunit Med18 [Lipomyces tetrasporus]
MSTGAATSLQELSLYAAIAPARLAKLLSTLSAITGMRPVPVLEHHIVFSPTSPAPSGALHPAVGPAATQLEASRIDVHRDLTAADDQSDARPTKSSSWTLTIPTIPESSKRNVQVQYINKTVFGSDDQIETDDTSVLFRFLRALNYVYAYDYLERGYLFVHSGVVVIKVTQLSPQSPPQLHEIPVGDGDDTVADNVAQHRDPATAKFLGVWVVHARVDIVTGSDSVGDDLEKVGIATERLEGLKAEIAGVVELGIPDRGILDPRVQIRKEVLHTV